ncbi:OmpH family outer membrane protein [Thalassotalea sp. LPB0316]|uniref:OmpH family outer membrane protein n=1 Tax=Thalassotalea sp. LPB0316 TaxID=2769490 RepID=UPI001D0564BB|nr:OmpH family outer membrane protein [Thalassotalea sp. LPB0316]
MKNVFKKAAIAAVASSALLSGAAFAAEQKLGVVNVQAIMKQLPQSAAMVQALNAEFKDETAEVAQIEKDIKYYQEKQKRDGALMSEKEKEELNQQIANLFQNYQTKGKALQQKIQMRQNEETNKILALVRQAVNNIAESEKFDVIVEQKAVVFAKPDADLTSKVVEQVSKLQ